MQSRSIYFLCRCSLGFVTHSTSDVSGAGMCDKPLRMSAWEAIYFLDYFVILLSSCNLLDLSSFNLLFGCFSYYFIQMCWKIMMIL